MHSYTYTGLMKVIKGPPPKPRPPGREVVSFRLDNEVMNKIDLLAHRLAVSRSQLVEAILKQAISDPKFVVRLS
jgi:hypothetical protein